MTVHLTERVYLMSIFSEMIFKINAFNVSIN